MNKFFLFPLVLACVLLGAGLVLGTVEQIVYPAPNDIISESSRVRLNVLSSDNSSDCVFSYDDTYNQSVSCNGTSLVNLPSVSETYRIRVTDSDSSFVDQQLTIAKPIGGVAVFVYALTLLVLIAWLYFFVLTIVKSALLEVGVYHLLAVIIVFFLFLFVYQLNLDYVNSPFILGWLDLFLNIFNYVILVFSFLSFVVCSIVRSFKKKNVLSVQEFNGRFF